MKTIVITDAISEPITLAEAKAQLRLTDLFTADDAYITALITVARKRAEDYCNRFFTEQTIVMVLDDQPGYTIFLPYPDLQSVGSITYLDDSNVEQTVDAADYDFFPQLQEIRNQTGFVEGTGYKVSATTGAPVDIQAAKQAMLMMITDMYELRTEAVIGASVAENHAVRAMLYPYRENLSI